MSDDIVRKTALELIAEGNKDTIDSCSSLFESSKLQMRIFLVEQAKRELNAIIKYTKLLDKLQDKYEEKLTEYLDDSNNENVLITALPYFINHISKCIDRSNSIIKEILGNNKLMDILYVNMSQNNTTNVSNNYLASNLSDPQSRQKVRNTISKILSQINIEDNKQ